VYRWIEHTGELELSIEARSDVSAFEDALAALGKLLGEDGSGEPATRQVSASAPDRATVEGRLSNPPHLVKAVTYHRLSLEAQEGIWRGTVVLDV
jgi:SHS2 domain-containing protein